MTVHLKKLSVGSESLASLRQWQEARRKAGFELMHVTRNTPRRAEEVLDGGSIFWVIKGVMCARQPIVELREMQRADGKPACGIVLAPRFSRWSRCGCGFSRDGAISRSRMRRRTCRWWQTVTRRCRRNWSPNFANSGFSSSSSASPTGRRTGPARCRARRVRLPSRPSHNPLNSGGRPWPVPWPPAPRLYRSRRHGSA